MMGFWNWGTGGAWMGMLFMCVFWVCIIGLIIWGILRLSRHSGTPTKSSPLEIAKERYARGEITKDQFDQLKKDLN